MNAVPVSVSLAVDFPIARATCKSGDSALDTFTRHSTEQWVGSNANGKWV